MPGSPIRRARREAEKREAELRQSDPERWAAEQMLRQQQQEAEQQQSTGDQSTLAPLSPTENRERVRNARELLPILLEGAQLGSEGLVASIRSGLIRGRDLAIATGVLVDKVVKLEQGAPPDEPPSLAELEAAEAEAARIYAARKGRG